jgi:ABC-type Fe3+/spermidine/putrescine transport system ATPase subunit
VWSIDPATVATQAKGLDGATALMVRPESISLVASERDIPAGANFVRARIRDSEYVGSHRTLLLEYADGVNGKARVDAVLTDLHIGDDVIAWWRPASQRVVAA